MSEALVIVLIVALLVALVAVVILGRRKPSAPPFDEEALGRLVERAVNHRVPEGLDPDPTAKPGLAHFALLSHEATAAAEAADAVRRTASEAADELQNRSRRDADQVRADARAEAERA